MRLEHDGAEYLSGPEAKKWLSLLARRNLERQGSFSNT